MAEPDRGGLGSPVLAEGSSGLGDAQDGAEAEEHGDAGDAEDGGVAPDGDRTADRRTDEEAPELGALQLAEAGRAAVGRGEVGERGEERGDVGAAARSLGGAEEGEDPERAAVGEEREADRRVAEAGADEDGAAADPVGEPAGGDLDEGVRHHRAGDEEGGVEGAPAAVADVEGDHGEERGDAGEHDELAEQEGAGGIGGARASGHLWRGVVPSPGLPGMTATPSRHN